MKTMASKSAIFLSILSAILYTSSVLAEAPIPPIDWSHTTVLNDSSTGEPRMQLGFYPPDPVQPSALNLSDPTTIISTYSSTNPSSHLVIAMDNEFVPLSASVSGIPDDNGHFEFGFVNGLSGASVYTVILDLTTSSNGIPDSASWVAFNPQPEPPALSTNASAIEFYFDFTSMSDATLSMQVLDPDGAALAFSNVPIPGAVWLFATGIFTLLGLGRSKRKTNT